MTCSSLCAAEHPGCEHEEIERIRSRALLDAAEALDLQPPMLHAHYVATLRLYAYEPWRLSQPKPSA